MKARAKHVWAKSPITMIVCRARERKKNRYSVTMNRKHAVFVLFSNCLHQINHHEPIIDRCSINLCNRERQGLPKSNRQKGITRTRQINKLSTSNVINYLLADCVYWHHRQRTVFAFLTFCLRQVALCFWASFRTHLFCFDFFSLCVVFSAPSTTPVRIPAFGFPTVVHKTTTRGS